MHDQEHVAPSDTPDESEPAISNRAHALALDILHRIRPVCAHMPDEELLDLSTRMALVELRYFERAAPRQVARRRSAHG